MSELLRAAKTKGLIENRVLTLDDGWGYKSVSDQME